jgi:hypothetical protein
MKTFITYFVLIFIYLLGLPNVSNPQSFERIIQKNEQHYLSNIIIVKYSARSFLKSTGSAQLSNALV